MRWGWTDDGNHRNMDSEYRQGLSLDGEQRFKAMIVMPTQLPEAKSLTIPSVGGDVGHKISYVLIVGV